MFPHRGLIGTSHHPHMRPLDPAEALDLQRRGCLTIVDVREARERAERIDGSEWISLSALPHLLAALPTDRPLAFVCHSGRRAAVAALMARAVGCEAHTITGGLVKWRELALPLETR
jgi:hydroxyacylglutathione hydrolase